MIQQLVEDTLKKEGKWSRTSLTMFTSYIFSLTIAALDYIQRGFNFEVFLTLIGLSAGVKFSAALEKRLTNKTNKDE